AEATGVRAAAPGRLPAADRAALERVPTEVASRFVADPLGVQGNQLIVAVAEPLKAEQVSAIAMASGLEPSQRIAPAVRVREALATGYGVPIARRYEA